MPGSLPGAAPSGDAVSARVLVVEDEAIVAHDAAATLRGLGYEVVGICDRGEQAVELILRERPDLVLMDIRIRGAIDGIEVADRVRRVASAAIVYLTSHSDPTTLARAKETHPHGYLLKPFDEQGLRTAVEIAIHKRKVEAALSEREHFYASTLGCLKDAVVITDASGSVRSLNPAACALLWPAARNSIRASSFLPTAAPAFGVSATSSSSRTSLKRSGTKTRCREKRFPSIGFGKRSRNFGHKPVPPSASPEVNTE